MKKKRIVFIIAISALSLIGLVIMQINWVLHAAKLRESQFNHRVTLAAYRITKKLEKDSLTTQNLRTNLAENQGKTLVLDIPLREKAKIDTLLKSEFRYHQINLAYSFELLDKENMRFPNSCSTAKKNTFSLCMEGIFKPQKAELRISFYNKNQYIYAQMGWMLLGSVLLIVMVITCFFLTIQTIWNQKKLSEMTSDFINNMTHELKTPISTISLASNMLQKDKILANQNKIIHYSGIIYDENKKLEAQVEQVLRIAKLERGDFQLNKVQTHIHELVQNAISTIDLQVKSKNGQIRCYLNAIKDTVVADATHLTNVISNLLDNANKYSTEKPLITVSTYNNEDGVVISVEDKGIGMSKDKQKYIFNKFYRVSTGNIHDVKGYGLGLAYVKVMVDAHKGQIHLNSEPGKGSRFDIFLPFA